MQVLQNSSETRDLLGRIRQLLLRQGEENRSGVRKGELRG